MTSSITEPQPGSPEEHAAARRRAAVRAEVTRARQRRRRWRRVRRRGRWVLLVLLLAVTGIAAWAGLSSRDDLLRARLAMEQGRSALLEGDVDRSLSAFDQAGRGFAAVERRLAGRMIRPLEAVPGLGANLRGTRMLAEAGGLLADAGSEVAAAALDLPDGLATLAPSDGTIPLAPLRQIAPALDRAAALGSRAEAVAVGAPQRLLLDEVALARAEVVAQTREINGTLSTAADLTAALPPFLGDDESRRYFFGAQNPAELRGTGGFIGAYTVLTVAGGRLEFGEFRSVIDIATTALDGVAAPSAAYEERYGELSQGLIQNVNMTPDFPTAAEHILNYYEVAKGERLDGVIVADPAALAALVDVTGPVDVPGVGSVAASEVVDLMAVEGYGYVPDSHDRKAVFGDVAAQALQRFITEGGAGNAVRGARALVDVAAAGHLLLYSTEAAEQERFVDLGVAGQMPSGAGDVLAVVVNNAAANKLDHFTDRAVRYETWLQSDGSGVGVITVQLESDAPTGGWPVDVIGPNIDGLSAGENFSLLSVYTAPGSSLERLITDDRVDDVEVGEDLGLTVLDSWEQYYPGVARTTTYVVRTPAVWQRENGIGRYRLAWHDQPTSRPTAVEVVVHPPPGRAILKGSDGVRLTGAEAVWAGRGDRLDVVEVEFSAGRSAL